jgi:S1-C subfamily serine protease
LTVTIRQRSGDGSAVQFTITDRDYDHDLVLCHIPGFRAVKPQKTTIPKGAAQPFASLAISTASPVTGRFILRSGFPLGSWTPTVQVGMVAATKLITPNTMYQTVIHKDGDDLLQISVSGNYGNSGGPVIELQSGLVIGVVDQFVPAPLEMGQPVFNSTTFSASGIMLAAPAKWVEALLDKNHIKSRGVDAGKLVIW